MSKVQVKQVLAELAEKQPRLSVICFLLFYHDEVLDAGDSGPSVEVEHVGVNARVPLWSFVSEFLHSGRHFLLLLLLVQLVEALFADNSIRNTIGWGNGDVRCHFSRAFQTENVGLVLYGDCLLALVWVHSVLCELFEGIAPKVAVELSPEKVR